MAALLAALVVLGPGGAPGVAAQPARITFKHLTVDDGLPVGSVNAVLQDRRGFMWFATWGGGLVRYDGYAFDAYLHDPNDSTSLSHNFLLGVYEDRDGIFWIRTLGGGLDRFDPLTETFSRVDLDPARPGRQGAEQVGVVYEDRSGGLWIGTDGAGLKRYERGTGAVRQYLHDPANPAGLSDTTNGVRAIYEDRAGVLWVGTSDGVLHRFDREAEAFARFMPAPEVRANPITAIVEDRQGHLWIGTEQTGLYRFDRARGTFTAYRHDPDDPASLCSNTVNTLHVDRSGALWMGSLAGGLSLFDHERGTFTSFRHRAGDAGSLARDRVNAIYEDRSGNLWVSTPDLGLNFFDRTTGFFTTLRHDPDDPESLRPGRVWSVYEDRAGTIWVGTRTGLVRFDRTAGTFEWLPGPLSVMSFREDRHGVLWMGTGSDGLYRYDRDTGAFTQYLFDEARPRNNHVRVVHEDRAGRIWFGTWGRGLFLLDQEADTLVSYTLGDGVAEHVVMAIHEDRAGRFWVGTWENGLFRFDPETGVFSRFIRDPERAPGLFTSTVLVIHETAAGTLWIGTVGGLYRLDPATGAVRAYTPQNSDLPHSEVRGILEDDDGRLWLSTGHGLARFDPATAIFKNFEVEDGLQGNDLGSGVRSRTGEMFFGGAGGIDAFFPDRIRDNPHPPQVALTGLRLFNEPVVPGAGSPLRQPLAVTEAIALAHDRNDLTFEYVSLHYSRPEHNQYAYRLDGYEEAWRYVGTQRTAIYPNLPPGDYTFRVKAANSDGVWNEEGAAVRVVIRPPWWQTPWAYALFGALLAAAAVAGERWQRRRVLGKERREALLREAELRAEALEAENRRKELELDKARAIEAMNARLEEQARRLVALDQAKSRFFANLSHEFRTPLTLILGPVESALTGDYGPLPPPLREGLDATRRQARRLLHLVGQLLDLARLENGRLALQPCRHDLVAFLRELVAAFAPLAERKRIALRLRTDVAALPRRFDRDKLEQALANLVGNALKFTPEGGKVWVSLSVRPDGAAGKAGGEDAAGVDIVVKDTGPGIPRGSLAAIFERFVQVDGSSTRRHEGTGIGLALARELVELHGGRILVESEEGFGSSFIVRLPPVAAGVPEPVEPVEADAPAAYGGDGLAAGLHPDEAALYAEVLPAPQDDTPGDDPQDDLGDDLEGDAAAPPAGRPTVLVADDNADVRAFLRHHLSASYHVLEADDGEAALHAARRHAPDLVLADVMMPGLDGFALCRALRAEHALAAVPVLLLTARAAEDDLVAGLADGADDYLTKPFRLEELKARMARLILSRRLLRARFSREVVVQPTGVVVAAADEVFLGQVLAAIEAHLADSGFGVERLAEAVGLSRRQLERRVGALVGETPSELLRRLRLERAGQLLAGRAGTVAEVAYAVGYDSPSYFSVVFRKHYGWSPTEHAGMCEAEGAVETDGAGEKAT